MHMHRIFLQEHLIWGVNTRHKMVHWQAIQKWRLDEGPRFPLLLITNLESIYIYLVAPNTFHSIRQIQVIVHTRVGILILATLL